MRDTLEIIKGLNTLFLDGDGVIFSGQVFVSPGGDIMKVRSVVDGQGIALLLGIGIHVVCITGDTSGCLENTFNKFNSELPSIKSEKMPPVIVYGGQVGEGKVKTAERYMKESGRPVSWETCAAMGDDLSDLKLLQKVAFAAAPAQAELEIKKVCTYISARKGGEGAIRDLANFIIKTRGNMKEDLRLQ